MLLFANLVEVLPAHDQSLSTQGGQFHVLQVLFRTVRFQQPSEQVKPVMVHINYHPDKLERARAAFRYFVGGDSTALREFPGGSEPGS